MNISCRKTKCKYNNNYVCTSKNIFIQKNLNCAYYQPTKKSDLQDVSKTMFELAPEIAPYKHNKKTNIMCEARCIFNKHNKCVCNGILINGESNKENDKKDSMVLNASENKDQRNNNQACCFSFVKKW